MLNSLPSIPSSIFLIYSETSNFVHKIPTILNHSGNFMDKGCIFIVSLKVTLKFVVLLYFYLNIPRITRQSLKN
jgi:hypothetical protein